MNSAGTIDDVCGVKEVKRRVDGKQFQEFNAKDYVSQATDYSAFSNFTRKSMVYDAVVGRLLDGIGYTTNLIAYAERHLNGSSKKKVDNVRYARSVLKTQLRAVQENSRFASSHNKAHEGKSVLEHKNPWHSAHSIELIPLKGPVYERKIKPYLHSR